MSVLPRRLRPRSIRAGVALAIAIALAVVFLTVQFVFGAIVESRARGEVERALAQQAGAIAREIDRQGAVNAAASARDAARFIGDARMVVRVSGEVVYWNAPVDDLEAGGEGGSGDISVLLERPDPSGGLSNWFWFALVSVGVVGAGVLVWFLSGTVAQRLRRSVARLADSAEAVSRGRLDVRAPETADELGRLAQAFNHMTARLEAADARQREFLADLAHELRTPVTAIEGFATALGDGTARSPEDRAESAAFIRAEAARLRDLVRDLQELTWLDLDPPVRAEGIDLAAAARETVARFAVDAHVRGVDLAGPEGALPALGDPAHVETILANLVRNALAATASGGSVRLEAVTAEGRVGVAVRDTGRGIAAEHLPHLFDRLYRVQASRDREAGGSGLGLSIVQRLATLLGGHVAVESRPGAGSTFTLWLPAPAVARARRAAVGSGPA
jgi:two-component system sensor histidine kinase BaeS